MKEEILRIEHVYKSYEGLPVLQDLNLNLTKGEILGILGLNESGKSTICKIIAGLTPIDSGRIFINGKKLVFKSNPREAQHVFFIQKNTNLIPNLSVAENLYLTRRPNNKSNSFHIRKEQANALSLCQHYGLEIDPSVPVNKYRQDQYFIFELLKARAFGIELIIVDLPLERHTVRDLNLFRSLITQMCSEGISFLILGNRSHTLVDFVDRIALLSNGRILKSIQRDEFSNERCRLYLEGGHILPKDSLTISQDNQLGSMVPRRVSANLHKNIQIPLEKGKITGIYDRDGSLFKTTLRDDIANERFSKMLKINGTQIPFHSDTQALSRGVGIMYAGSITAALIPNMTFINNILLTSRKRLGATFFFKPRSFRYLKKLYAQKLKIPESAISLPVSDLSIYSRVKIFLARWDFIPVKALFCELPYQGADQNIKNMLTEFFQQTASRQVAVAIYNNSNLEDLLEFCDDIIIVQNSRAEYFCRKTDSLSPAN